MKEFLSLNKRIGYSCPVEHISDPFFMLYTLNKEKVQEIDRIVAYVAGEDVTKEQAQQSLLFLQHEN